MDRLVRDLPHTLKHTTPGAVTAAGVKLTIKDSAGAVIVDNASAVAGANNQYTYELSSTKTTALDKYEVTWVYTIGATNPETYRPRSYYMVVGGYFFTIAEFREFHEGLAVGGSVDPSDQAIIDAREDAEELLERECHVAFVPQGRYLTVSGQGTDELFLEAPIRSVTAVTVNGTSLTQSELDALYVEGEEGIIGRDIIWPTGRRNITIRYEFGFDQPPGRIKNAAMILTRNRLAGSNLDDRAVSFTDETGTRQLAVASKRNPTGIPEVDAAIHEWNQRTPAIG